MRMAVIYRAIIDENGCYRTIIYENGCYMPIIDENGCYTPIIDENGCYTPIIDENGCYTSIIDENGCYTSIIDENGCYRTIMDENGCYMTIIDENGCYRTIIDENGCYTPIVDENGGKTGRILHEYDGYNILNYWLWTVLHTNRTNTGGWTILIFSLFKYMQIGNKIHCQSVFFHEGIGRQDVCPIWLPASATFCLRFYVICMYYHYNLACCK